MTSGVYLIFNKDTGQLYPGGSINIEKRIKQHVTSPYKGSYIDRAIIKHGWDRFGWVILEETEPDWKIIGAREKYWIAYYDAFDDSFHYNLTRGGEGVSGYRKPYEAFKYTVAKDGFSKGEQRYTICDRDRNSIKSSVNKEALDEIVVALNNGEITEEEVKEINIELPFEYTVSKYGFRKGKQNYTIRDRNQNPIKQSVNKDALDEIAVALNNSSLTEEEVKAFKYTVSKNGYSNGKQMYTICDRNHNSIKSSVNKEALDKIAVALNDGSLTEEEVKNNRGVDFIWG